MTGMLEVATVMCMAANVLTAIAMIVVIVTILRRYR